MQTPNRCARSPSGRHGIPIVPVVTEPNAATWRGVVRSAAESGPKEELALLIAAPAFPLMANCGAREFGMDVKRVHSFRLAAAVPVQLRHVPRVGSRDARCGNPIQLQIPMANG